MKKNVLIFSAIGSLLLTTAAAQGIWDKTKYPEAEPIRESLLPEFRWQPGESNRPVGTARGIFPGRVVFTRYPEVCKWKGRWREERDQWFLPENTDQEKCCEMMSATLQRLTGAATDREAWDKIFAYYHQRTGGRNRGYRKGEIVAVKVNLNNAKARESHSNMSDEAPQVIVAMIRQLVEAAGVAPRDIVIYDARRPIAPEILNAIWSEYPDVRFLQDDPGIRDYQPINPKTGDYSLLQKPDWVEAVNFSHGEFSGARLIPRQIVEATYLVNLAMLKLHSYPYNYMEGGDEGQTAVTMTAKNHAGSVRAPWEMHHFLNTQQDGHAHAYSPLVDLNASPNLGAKTILYMLDGLYCGRKHASYPLHFPNAPFFNRVDDYENSEWPASLLASLDEVALESVGLDLLYAQSLYNEEGGFHHVPRILVRNHASDYLLEMADPQHAPSGIRYMQGGRPVESLGVFEHWDSPATMRYSRNLDPVNGKGIELVYLPMGSAPRELKEPSWFYWQNPIKSGIDPGGLRDCQVFRAEGHWYMTGTSAPHWGDGTGNPGVVLYRSDNLTDWEKVGIIVENPGPSKWYWQRFWAPEIACIDGRYYCTFNCKNDRLGVPQSFGLAVADRVEGPYTVLTSDAPVAPGNDATLFQDDDGEVYAIWCGGDNINTMTIAAIDLERGALKEPGTVLFGGTPGTWDAAGVEGATLLKRDGRYLMFYSSWTRGYEVGVATATDIRGPWTKAAEPVFGSQSKSKWAEATETDYADIGHNSIFRGPDGQWWISCHGQLQGDDGPWLCIEPLHFGADGMPSVIYPSHTPQRVALPDTVRLVPDMPSQAPDYFCTWNLQGYLTSYHGSVGMRAAMTEKSLFGDAPFEGWARLYPRIREDLIFVMDDSWDIPADVNSKTENPYLGLTELDTSRFPSFRGRPAERLRALTDSIKAYGWRSLGGWICAQKAEIEAKKNETSYWKERLEAARKAGFSYWKVDWGSQSRNDAWRRMLTRLGRKYAPELVIEHAMKPEYITFSDTYRTYDVENITAQPVTIRRISELLPYRAEPGAAGIINCEDEPYIAAGLGCAIGVMRHPFAGNVPDGNTDRAFPSTVRDLKRRINEIERAVRWHRIAQPFGVDGDGRVDEQQLEDNWEFRANESYLPHEIGSLVRESAPARVSRGMPLPEVDDTTADRPYVLASTYPNGAVAVAAIGRTLGRNYRSKAVSVTIEVADIFAPIGIFGYYSELIIRFDPALLQKPVRVYAQDLLAESAVDITDEVQFGDGRLLIPGHVLRSIGLSAGTPGDISDPGLIIQLQGE